jgi:hypothetical protein
MTLRRHMRGRGRRREKLLVSFDNLYALAPAVEISDRPKVAVRLKVVVVNPTEIKKVVHKRPVLAV